MARPDGRGGVWACRRRAAPRLAESGADSAWQPRPRPELRAVGADGRGGRALRPCHRSPPSACASGPAAGGSAHCPAGPRGLPLLRVLRPRRQHCPRLGIPMGLLAPGHAAGVPLRPMQSADAAGGAHARRAAARPRPEDTSAGRLDHHLHTRHRRRYGSVDCVGLPGQMTLPADGEGRLLWARKPAHIETVRGR